MKSLRFAAAFTAASLVLAASVTTRAQQAPPAQTAPVGPLAPEKYMDIQVLKDVPADQLDLTMQYFMAATGFTCGQCHVRDQATGAFTFMADTRLKTTARQMIQLVQTVNAGSFGARINCATCHQGRNQPAGLQPAQMFTADQLAAMAAQQAARQGGAPGGAGAAGAAGAPGGRGAGANQTPAPPIDDVLNKYITAIGGQAAIDKQNSRVMSGTLVNRSGQSMPFTIEEKGAKIRESITTPQGTNVSVYDGTAAWAQAGETIGDLPGFRMQQASRLNDLRRAAEIRTRYQNLTAARPTRLTLTPGAAPIDVNLLQGAPFAGVTERLYFDANSGLLIRRQIITRTPLNGTLTEIIDYSDYKDVAGVKIPFTIKRNNWNSLDVLTVVDVKPNASVDDARFVKPAK
ncbi:MAG: photosynthetic reaction center cytochrome c subunit [Acidobacteria bacterium]|nr:MAG: photosynthetic reaction center cytochrome c subunit [Acidobacteriota bacterium]